MPTEAQFQLDTLIDNLPLALITYRHDPADDSLTLVRANAAADAMLGFAISSRAGATLPELFPGADETGLPQRYREVAQDGGSFKETQRHYHDEVVAGAFDSVNFQSAPGEVTIVFADVTERVRSEDEKAKAAGRLERLNRALEVSNEELHKFAHVASHDLQTPLRSISGFASLLERKYAASLDDQARDYIHRIVDGCGTMSSLIQDLLAYSRVDSKASPFVRVPLGDVVDEVVDTLGSTIEEVGAEVRRDDALPVVKGDRIQLIQLFQNLIGNALKYRSEDAPKITLAVERHDDTWHIAVSDNGIGIAARHLDRIFDPFARLHTASEYPGNGIGLAICRRVVERHHGAIAVASEEGRGTTFRVELPAIVDPAPSNP